MSLHKVHSEKKLKRLCEDLESQNELEIKKPKIQLAPTVESEEITSDSLSKSRPKAGEQRNFKKFEPVTPSQTAPRSPKKRLEVDRETSKNSQKFIYGNYSQYYGYRNREQNSNSFHDVRLDVFATQKELFRNKKLLDIGCNTGFVTLELAKHFELETIIGIDIDPKLIKNATKHLLQLKRTLSADKKSIKQNEFPYNISFVHGNYVLRDDVLLEIEKPQFDVILCLSVTKWIHLNFGDSGLKQAFRRMFLQLNNGGKLILEAQPFKGYGKRKKLTDEIFQNFKAIKFLPQDFTKYLLSEEVGFRRVEALGVPEHFIEGFKRPIQIFYKE